MRYVQHDDCVRLVIDPIPDAPTLAPGARSTGQRIRRAAGGRHGTDFPATGQGRTQRPLWRLSRADAQADAGHADEPQSASARQHRSRGAGATKQVSETAPELVLVNARLIFALVSALACRVTSFSRITAPPCRRLRRLQFVQALPLLGGDQDYRAVARPHQSYRSATSLHRSAIASETDPRRRPSAHAVHHGADRRPDQRILAAWDARQPENARRTATGCPRKPAAPPQDPHRARRRRPALAAAPAPEPPRTRHHDSASTPAHATDHPAKQKGRQPAPSRTSPPGQDHRTTPNVRGKRENRPH